MVVYIVELVETKGCENMGVFESLVAAIEYAETIADERLSDPVIKEVQDVRGVLQLDGVRFRLRGDKESPWADSQVVDVIEYRVQ